MCIFKYTYNQLVLGGIFALLAIVCVGILVPKIDAYSSFFEMINRNDPSRLLQLERVNEWLVSCLALVIHYHYTLWNKYVIANGYWIYRESTKTRQQSDSAFSLSHNSHICTVVRWYLYKTPPAGRSLTTRRKFLIGKSLLLNHVT